MFVHYPPTYWHLHIHFVNVELTQKGVNSGRAVLLDDIIENIECKSDYYQNASLTMEIKEGTKLHKILKEHDLM